MASSHILDKAYTEEQLSGFKDVFTKMKTYKDGTIHKSEHLAYLNSIGLPTTPAQVEVYQAMFRAQRGDDLIPLKDVIEYLRHLHEPATLTLEVAKHFDKDKDGVISEEEFQLGMKVLVSFDPATYGDKAKISFAQLLQEADANKDGKIQIEELATWLGEQQPSRILDRAFTPEELEEFRNLFRTMRTYKDGSIHNSELRLFQNLTGVSTTEAQVKVYSKYFHGLTGSDRVPMEELMRIFGCLHNPKGLVLELCHQFDRNKDGVINQAEFEIGMKCLVAYDPLTFGEKGKIGFEQMLKEADTNKDGKIQIPEMAAWLSNSTM